MLTIKEILPLEGYKLQILFSSGESKIADLSGLCHEGVFRELQDVSYFRQVKNQGYFIEWPHEQDLSAETLYREGVQSKDLKEESFEVKDPLKK